MKQLGCILVFLVLTLGNINIGLAQWSGCELPAVTGPYGVGTVVLPMVDAARPGVYADGSSSKNRELMTQVWYPADRGTLGPPSTYMDEPTAEYFLKEVNNPNLDKNSRLLIHTHGVVGAQAAAGHERFPVLIFSPGWRTSYFLYQSILEELASHGYIVIGVNSPNSAGITAFPDGHVRMTPEVEDEDTKGKYNQEIADDLKFISKQLWMIDSNSHLPLAGRIDFGHVGYFGHSFGGAAAIQASIQSLQLTPAANFDGSPRGRGYERPITQPMLMVWSELHPQGDWTMGMIWGNLPRGSVQAQVKGTDHMSFSDYLLIAESMMGQSQAENHNPIDPVRAIQLSRDTLRNFFDVTLKHADPKEMHKLYRQYPELKMEGK